MQEKFTEDRRNFLIRLLSAEQLRGKAIRYLEDYGYIEGYIEAAAMLLRCSMEYGLAYYGGGECQMEVTLRCKREELERLERSKARNEGPNLKAQLLQAVRASLPSGFDVFKLDFRADAAESSRRAVTSPEEVKDSEKFESAQKPPERMPWHSEGFATIRKFNSKGEMVEPLPLSNEFRALCQLLAERPDQIAQFSEIEPQIGTRTHELDIAAKAINPAQKGERRVRDLLRTKTGKRLLKWGVLIEKEVGREKFLKLSPPKHAQ